MYFVTHDYDNVHTGQRSQARRRCSNEDSLVGRQRRHRYTIAQQLDMAQAANKEGASVSAVAREFHVSRRTIRRALKNYQRNSLQEHREKFLDETMPGE